MVAKMVKSRREELDILEEEHAADERKLRVLLERMDKRKEKIDPKREARIDEENRYIGSIARLLVADDTALKRRFVQQAVKTYGGVGDTRARRYLERLIGKIPVTEMKPTAGSDSLMDAAAE
jgi:ParB-like chromosome segregation protein Spo0J